MYQQGYATPYLGDVVMQDGFSIRAHENPFPEMDIVPALQKPKVGISESQETRAPRRGIVTMIVGLFR